MQLWIKEPTPADILHYNFSKKCAEGLWYEVGPYEVEAYNQCWRYRKVTAPYELVATCMIALHCHEAQNPYFTRYAYAREILPDDPEYALYVRLDDCVEQGLRFAEVLISLHGRTWREGITYLSTTLNLSYEDSLYWLKMLIVVQCERYGFDVPTDDYLALRYYAEATRVNPLTFIFWGETPPSFNDLVAANFALEGLELQDKIDEISYDAAAHIDFAGFFEANRVRIEEHQKGVKLRFTLLSIFVLGVVALPAIMTAVSTALAAVTTSTSMALSLVGKLQLFAEVFVASLGLSLKALLTAIQFNTLVGVHKIALLVSEDYRAVMNQVYGEIRKVSSALGYGPEFILLLTQNTKRLVQDVGTTFGRQWDMNEVQWLSTFQGYMTKFQGAAYRYRDNPEAVLFDLSRWVEEDAINLKGAFMGKLITDVSNVVEKTGEIIGNIVTVRADINALVMGLPEKISRQIDDAISPYVSKFDDFITDTYDPYKREIDGIIGGLKEYQDELGKRAVELAERLKKPADYLLEIDYMPEDERLDQERKIADISTREYHRDVDAFTPLSEPASAELEQIREALKIALPMPMSFPEEMEGPQRPQGVKAEPRKTWFVGDY